MRHILPFILAASMCFGIDWYTNYVNNDASLLGHFTFNEVLQDAISKRPAKLTNAVFKEGWVPQDGYILAENTKLTVNDIPDCAQRKDYTLGVYAKIIGGGGYLVLKKGGFGINFNDGKAGAYIRIANKDVTFPAGNYDSGWHFWTLTVEGKNVAVYCDGAKVGGRTLESLPETNTNPLLVGHSGGWGQKSITGEVKSLFLYSRALSAAEIKKQAEAFANGQRPAPLSDLEMSLPAGAGNKFYQDNVSYEKKEQALYFNGTDAFATLPDYPALNETQSLTVGCWIKPENTMPRKLEEQGYIFSKNEGSHRGWAMATFYSNGLQALIVTDKGKFNANAHNVLTPNVWQHVAFGWDGERLQLFVNGIAVGQAVPTQGRLLNLNLPITLGKAADRDGLYYKGAIDEVRIYAAGLMTEADPETGKEVITPASNIDPTPDRRNLPPFRATAGRKPLHKPLFDFEDLTGWKVRTYKRIANAEFVRSQDDRLWDDYTGKLTITLDKVYDPSKRVVALIPPKPLVINEPFDYVELWVSAQNWAQGGNRPRAIIVFKGADGEVIELDTTSREHPFIYWSGWSAIVKKLHKVPKLPATIEEIKITGFTGTMDNLLYFDNLAVFKAPEKIPAEAIEIPTWDELGIKNADSGVAMPAASAKGQPIAVRKQGNAYSFTAQNPKIVWNYTPLTGTFADITVAGNARPVRPMDKGGFRFVKKDGSNIEPDDPKLTSILLKCESTADSVTSHWQWKYDGAPIETTAIKLTAKGHTLSVSLTAAEGAVNQVVFGEATSANNPIITTVPYWVTLGGAPTNPAVMYSAGLVFSEFVDIYASRSSELFGGSKKTGDVSAQLNGGVRYNKKTDGTRNPVKEIFHVTVSDKVEDVLPHIPNPPNSTNEITQHGIWMSFAWYDTMPMPDYFERCYRRQKLLYDYGIRNAFVRDHQSLNRQYAPKRRGGFESMITEICPDVGGDEPARDYFQRCIKEFGYRMGLYSNYTLLDPTNLNEGKDWRFALDSNGDPRYGSGDARMFKYAYMLECQRRLNANLKRKFNTNLSYPDQYTCRAPWEYTDYDARVPEAGSFNPVLRVFAASMLQEKKDFEVTLSEGIMQWPLAGYVDSYSQPGSKDDPLFPEFQLRELHVLGNDCATHLSWPNNRAPGAIDHLLTMTLGCGNIAHIYGVGLATNNGAPPKSLTYPMLKSYYAMVQAQKHYANYPVEKILYHLNGKMLTATEVLAQNAVAHGQVYTKYTSGFEIWANANKTENWEITVNGNKHLLPPDGYYMYGKGMSEGGSEIVDGRRVDSLKGDLWLFANGNGKDIDFGYLKCKGAYAVRWDKDMLEVIALPTARDEEIVIDTAALPYRPGKKAAYIATDGTIVKTSDIAIGGDGKLRLPMANGMFKVQITK